MKLLLDTDIGSDIDDAVCLAYLLARPDCDLLGITTVTGDTVARAKLASVLCTIAQKNVPIYPGIAKPLIVPMKQPSVPQAASLVRWPHQEKFESFHAIEFLRQTIRKHPGEITLLGIGPLTNIATLFVIDSEIPSLLKSIVLMAGSFTPVPQGDQPCEWNVINDPHAAAIVYAADVPISRSIGLDVTLQVKMEANEVKQRFAHPLLRPVVDFAGSWFEHTKFITFHDPLAATTIFNPTVCDFSPGNVSIELTSPVLSGYTHWDRKASPARHEIATTVQVQEFFDEYFSVFHAVSL